MKDTRPQWLIDLDVVATTPEQARQIIKRNKALLRELKKAEPKLLKKRIPDGWYRTKNRDVRKSLRIDCPHCGEEVDCGDCAWWAYAQVLGACCCGDFDGHTLDDVSNYAPISVSFWPSKACIDVIDGGQGLRSFKIEEIRDCIADIRKFLEAHVTWGKDVIKRSKK